MEQASLESSTFGGASRDTTQARVSAPPAPRSVPGPTDAPEAASAAIGSFSLRGAGVAVLVLVAASLARHGVTERSVAGYVLASVCLAFAAGTYVVVRRCAQADVAAAFVRSGASERDAASRAKAMIERAERR